MSGQSSLDPPRQSKAFEGLLQRRAVCGLLVRGQGQPMGKDVALSFRRIELARRGERDVDALCQPKETTSWPSIRADRRSDRGKSCFACGTECEVHLCECFALRKKDGAGLLDQKNLYRLCIPRPGNEIRFLCSHQKEKLITISSACNSLVISNHLNLLPFPAPALASTVG